MHLLVPRQHGVEDSLAGGHAVGRDRPDGLTLEDLAVGQDQQSSVPRRGLIVGAHRWASPSTTAGVPRSTV